MKKMIFGLLAIATLVLATSCNENEDQAKQEQLYETGIDKGTPPPPNGLNQETELETRSIEKGTPPPKNG